MTPSFRRKLIEVALTLEAIDKESAREKSIRRPPFHALPLVGTAKHRLVYENGSSKVGES